LDDGLYLYDFTFYIYLFPAENDGEKLVILGTTPQYMNLCL